MSEKPTGHLNGAAARLLAGSMPHWVGHTFGAAVQLAYARDLRAARERLHGELLSLVPLGPDAGLVMVVLPAVSDTAFACTAHPQFAALPPTGRVGWFAALQARRRDDGSAGADSALQVHRTAGGPADAEADSDLVGNLLAALAGYGGTLYVGVHGPRPASGQQAPVPPVSAAASWVVEPIGCGVPPQNRPVLLVSPDGPLDPREPPSQLAACATPPADGGPPPWTALTGALWDAPETCDTAAWRRADPGGFMDTLAGALGRMARRPELDHPTATAAAVAQLAAAANSADQDGNRLHLRAAARAAAAHLSGRCDLATLARRLYPEHPVQAAHFSHRVAGLIAYYWQRHLSYQLLLPATGPDQDQLGLVRLRAAIWRELAQA